MSFIDLIKTAFTALGSNKTRTSLTMLGIIIGIASVITLLGVGSGSQNSIQQSVSALGSNILTISAGSQRTGLVQGGSGTAATLTLEDADAIKSKVSNISAVSPEASRNFQIIANGNNTNTSVTGVLPDYLIAHNYQIQSGNFITTENNDSMGKVAVIGPDTAKNLFVDQDPIGQTIKINKISFKVIGLTVTKGSSGFQNLDDIILIPLQTAQKILLGQSNIRSIVVSASSDKSLTQVQNDITTLLMQRHNISDSTQLDFTIRNSADTLSALSSVTSTITGLLSSIAGISLLVGGIGIMNIMIVTVTERTREIGLRKAVGARNRDILAQFLVEAVILTLLGGIIGVLIGILLGFLISTFANIATQVQLNSIFLATGVSVLIGIVFGLYPARKASKLSPIEALRFE